MRPSRPRGDRLDTCEAEGIASHETCEARVPGSFHDAPVGAEPDAV
jgi:hypothetical protein